MSFSIILISLYNIKYIYLFNLQTIIRILLYNILVKNFRKKNSLMIKSKLINNQITINIDRNFNNL